LNLLGLAGAGRMLAANIGSTAGSVAAVLHRSATLTQSH